MATVVTNGRMRPLFEFAELEPHERADFPYVQEDEHLQKRFAWYGRRWYDVNDAVPVNGQSAFAVTVPESHPLAAWALVIVENFSGGVAFRWPTLEQVRAVDTWSEVHDYVIVGRYDA